MDTASYEQQHLLVQARHALETSHVSLAFQLCSQFLEKHPDDPIALELAAEIALDMDKDVQAQAYLIKAIDIAPDTGSGKFLMLAGLEQGHEAVRLYERGVALLEQELIALNNTPTNPSLQGVAVVEEEEEEEDVLTQRRDMVRKAAEALVAATEIYLTDLCFEQDAEQRCEHYLTQALQLDPSCASAHATLASVRLSQCRPDDARSSLQHSLALWNIHDPESTPDTTPTYDSRLATAKLLLELDEDDVALDVISGLEKEDDLVPDIWYLYGFIYYRQGTLVNDDVLRRGEVWADAQECLMRAQELLQALQEMDEVQVDLGMLEHTQELLNEVADVVKTWKKERRKLEKESLETAHDDVEDIVTSDDDMED